MIDQLVLKDSMRSRLSESINTALVMGQGRLVIEGQDGKRDFYSMHSSCPICKFSFPELEPRLFSFNNPRGSCPTCLGLGTTDLVEQETSSFGEGGKVLGKVTYIHRRSGKKTDEESEEDADPGLDSLTDCPDCHGTRLKPASLSVRIQNKNIAELASLSCGELRSWVAALELSQKNSFIAEKINQQILTRLDYLLQVGTGYLSLDRPSRTLSGGEAQRIRLATQVGSALVGVLYVMDEPSIGLHPRDHHRLLDVIGGLRDRGNTILLVEHDEDTIRFADHVIDIGPRAGKLGGHLLAEGTPQDIEKNPKSLTGQYLSGLKRIEVPKLRRRGIGQSIYLNGAVGHNLQNVNLRLPLGCLTVVTGVSGSGKSTLIMDTLYRILAQKLNRSPLVPSPYKDIQGLDELDKVIHINQQPIGRTPRSTPATYVGILPLVRDLYANLPDSKLRGYTPGHFSFNVKGGRCETCQGHGLIRMEMHFLADVFVTCDSCRGLRYNRETLQVRYNQKNISDILQMTVEEALEFFKNHSHIYRKLLTLHQVGLDYMTLGQSSTTLSGGEAQRIKLSKELSKRSTGRTLYILDEPTTGLHFEDVKKLVELLQSLVDQKNTVIVIEHNLDVVKSADHVIDMGPEGGQGGGRILAEGTPEEIVKVADSHTGRFLKALLKK